MAGAGLGEDLRALGDAGDCELGLAKGRGVGRDWAQQGQRVGISAGGPSRNEGAEVGTSVLW